MSNDYFVQAELDQDETLMKNQQQIVARLENAVNPVLELA